MCSKSRSSASVLPNGDQCVQDPSVVVISTLPSMVFLKYLMLSQQLQQLGESLWVAGEEDSTWRPTEVSSIVEPRERREGRDSGHFATFAFPDFISNSIHDLADSSLEKIINVYFEFFLPFYWPCLPSSSPITLFCHCICKRFLSALFSEHTTCPRCFVSWHELLYDLPIAYFSAS